MNQFGSHMWNGNYAKDATWVIPGPSTELVQCLQVGSIDPCRAFKLGCGTGGSAVFLAQLGFDVVAADYSKAAVEEARQLADSCRNKRRESHFFEIQDGQGRQLY